MKRTYYANIYRPFAGSCGTVYATRELADQMAAPERLDCAEFTAEIPASGEQHASDKSEHPAD